MTTTSTAQRSRLDPEAMPRRDFLGIAALASMAASMLFALAGILRLPRANTPPLSRKIATERPGGTSPCPSASDSGSVTRYFFDGAGRTADG
jgi:hypothetical protein